MYDKVENADGAHAIRRPKRHNVICKHHNGSLIIIIIASHDARNVLAHTNTHINNALGLYRYKYCNVCTYKNKIKNLKKEKCIPRRQIDSL